VTSRNALPYFEQRSQAADQGGWRRCNHPRAWKYVTSTVLGQNFAEHFLNVVGYVEPRPGIPPRSADTTVELIQQ